MAVSSSESERNFSSHGFIQSKLRNRVKDESCEKLVYVFTNSKSIKRNQNLYATDEKEIEISLEISKDQLE